MQAILSYFWQLCLLRAGPEKIPPSYAIMGVLAAVYLVIQSVSLSFTRPDLGLVVVMGTTLAGPVLEGGMLYLLLLFKRHSSRFVSTLAALFGVNTIILILLMPTNYLLSVMSSGFLSDLVWALSLVLLFWGLIVVGFILHRASSVSMSQGVVLAFVMELIAVLILNSIFPQLLPGD